MVLVWQSPGGPPTTFHQVKYQCISGISHAVSLFPFLQMLFRARMSINQGLEGFCSQNYCYIKALFAFGVCADVYQCVYIWQTTQLRRTTKELS